ncbi:hypothetical protein HaLaN_11883 [Haematococcus lacustris]|uniref:Uncharacterized protein n=1 Tax=Haematococcus lacustris TaxID=44745 RepID=A0A699Z8Q7_HAELA|nr:hypothetical protein HaLaN_11883 [Haematococcus lacustris]
MLHPQAYTADKFAGECLTVSALSKTPPSLALAQKSWKSFIQTMPRTADVKLSSVEVAALGRKVSVAVSYMPCHMPLPANVLGFNVHVGVNVHDHRQCSPSPSAMRVCRWCQVRKHMTFKASCSGTKFRKGKPADDVPTLVKDAVSIVGQQGLVRPPADMTVAQYALFIENHYGGASPLQQLLSKQRASSGGHAATDAAVDQAVALEIAKRVGQPGVPHAPRGVQPGTAVSTVRACCSCMAGAGAHITQPVLLGSATWAEGSGSRGPESPVFQLSLP